MIVVIDTSAWISALQFAGRNTPPILAVEKALRRCNLVTTPAINAEIQRTLVEKFQWRSSKATRIINTYFKNAKSVDISGELHVCRDPNDDMVLECASSRVRSSSSPATKTCLCSIHFGASASSQPQTSSLSMCRP